MVKTVGTKARAKREAAFNCNSITKEGYQDLIFCLEQLNLIEHAQDDKKIGVLQEKYGVQKW